MAHHTLHTLKASNTHVLLACVTIAPFQHTNRQPLHSSPQPLHQRYRQFAQPHLPSVARTCAKAPDHATPRTYCSLTILTSLLSLPTTPRSLFLNLSSLSFLSSLLLPLVLKLGAGLFFRLRCGTQCACTCLLSFFAKYPQLM